MMDECRFFLPSLDLLTTHSLFLRYNAGLCLYPKKAVKIGLVISEARRNMFHKLKKWSLIIVMGLSLAMIILCIFFLSRVPIPIKEILFSLNTGFIAILLASFFIYKILAQKIKSNKMAEIAGDIRNGANTYLTRQIRTILLITPIFVIAIGFLLSWQAALTTILGIITSLTSAFVGMSVCVRANLRTADSALTSEYKPFQMAIFGGSVMGLCITGLSLVVLSILFLIFKRPEPLIGFGFGASLAALFAQIGGGIFTKSADVGADLVGKVEMNLPEDDPRNAAVIADLVGDNVGDCAGRGADLLQTFADDIVTGVIVAVAFIPRFGVNAMFFPLLLKSTGVLASLVGILVTGIWKNHFSFTKIFNIGLWISTGLSIAAGFGVAHYTLKDWRIGVSIMLGVLVTMVAAISTTYYSGVGGRPVKEISNASKRGAALNLITGLGYGLQSPVIPIVAIISAILFAYNLADGMLLAIVGVNIGTDLLITFIMAADAFGPIVDNAHGIATLSKSKAEAVGTLSTLDSVGNTMKAVTKAYAMASGTITAFVIFATFFSLTKLDFISIGRPYALGFIFIGISLPYMISSLVIQSTARTATKMVDEIRQQFDANPKIMKGLVKPDYSRCIDISTKNALSEMFLPGAISIFFPILIGWLFGMVALGSLMIGAVASSALLGPFFNNVGTAFDNAKKLIEEKKGFKGTFQHAAAVVGDTVGDPLKDVAGPSVLIFMKLMGMTALLVAPIFLSVTPVFNLGF
jgi:K(+)-stimulated pyrophosphate-energized sodium pump